jgi:cell division transport system permease protein
MSRPESTASESRGASLRRRGPGAALAAWLARHRLAFGDTFRQLAARPISTLMTVAVIGIALALPAGLHALLANVRAVTSGWNGATQFSLFLKTGLPESRVAALAEELRARRDIASVRLISPDEALDEFRRLSGFGQALDALDGNPLPAVLVVRPSLKQGTAASVSALAQQLGSRPEVDFAQADVAWVQRLYAIMSIATRGVWLLAAMLGLAVLLVVGNTIRLAVQNRRDEIVIAKLIGATDAFIRRPFLYTGFWYGLAGGLLAVALVTGSLWAVRGPAEQLALLYHSDYALQGLGLVTGTEVILAGGVLGLLGAWIAVGRHLREIEPT